MVFFLGDTATATWLIIELSKVIPVMGYDVIDKVSLRLSELEEDNRVYILDWITRGLESLALKTDKKPSCL